MNTERERERQRETEIDRDRQRQRQIKKVEYVPNHFPIFLLSDSNGNPFQIATSVILTTCRTGYLGRRDLIDLTH